MADTFGAVPRRLKKSKSDVNILSQVFNRLSRGCTCAAKLASDYLYSATIRGVPGGYTFGVVPRWLKRSNSDVNISSQVIYILPKYLSNDRLSRIYAPR